MIRNIIKSTFTYVLVWAIITAILLYPVTLTLRVIAPDDTSLSLFCAAAVSVILAILARYSQAEYNQRDAEMRARVDADTRKDELDAIAKANRDAS